MKVAGESARRDGCLRRFGLAGVALAGCSSGDESAARLAESTAVTSRLTARTMGSTEVADDVSFDLAGFLMNLPL